MDNHVPMFQSITYISFFLLIIITFFPSQSLSNDYSYCNKYPYDDRSSYSCGNLSNIYYPFWGQNRPSKCGAGKPFYLNCDKNNITTILLYSQNFTVLDINTTSYTMKLKRTDLSQNLCSPQFGETYFDPTGLFHSSSMDISIYYNCPFNISYQKSLCGSNNPSFTDLNFEVAKNLYLNRCGKHIKVPRTIDLYKEIDYNYNRDDLERILNDGFEVEYSVNTDCLRCLGSENGDCSSYYIDNKNIDLCYYDYCPDGSIAIPITCITYKSSKHSIWQGKIITLGSASATFVGFSICVIIFYFTNKFIKNNQNITYENNKNNRDIEAFLKTHEAFTVRRYKFADIKKMTNNFEVKLGQGGYGIVYKGKLLNDRLVAVKILNASKGNGEEFMNEVSSITKTSHINVVALLGFCFDGSKKALIYELMSNGSLDKFIYNNQPKAIQSLSWEILYQIAKGIARGLEYLHKGCSTRILHFDIKPHNILLDENFCPKISDFGLARLCPKKESIISMSDARGTMGYVAPELWNRNFGGVSHKSDVYSFGMMLMEMVGGRKNIIADASQTSEIYFPHWVYKKLDLGTDLIPGEVITVEEGEIAKRMTIVGLWCIQTFPNDRPTMSRVIEMLEGNVNSLEIPPKPILSSPTRSVPGSSTS
ncbi:LEAF RUST 10 DISEASE-RESISTANCE LOCUS RECEPTOR-LIKE PROTEIN KINASE-like 2.4 [Trifolium pratense]|nr:LEAF RUST 10 DISEASE-RESISTANCE LOCUS RECEPTOR-LIKE PROTEIN KINASE-like 2.4 [Trifolium pratense]